MKVAIIENDSKEIQALKDAIRQQSWSVDFFESSKEFGQVALDDYDVIVAEAGLPDLSGSEILSAISGKTHARLYLLGRAAEHFSQEVVEHKEITGLIRKGNPRSVMKALSYEDTKIRLTGTMEEQNKAFGECVSATNGYVLDLDNDVMLIGVYSLMSSKSQKLLEGRVKKCPGCNGVIYLSGLDKVSTSYLPLLTRLYEMFRGLGRTMAFWDTGEIPGLRDLMKKCSLDTIFEIFDSKEDAVTYVRKHSPAMG